MAKKTESKVTAKEEIVKDVVPEDFTKAQVIKAKDIEVVLKDKSKHTATHIVFLKKDLIEFKNGKAVVKVSVAKQLAKIGVI